MWSAHRITEKQKAGKARNIKEKQLKNSRSTVSKPQDVLHSSQRDNQTYLNSPYIRHFSDLANIFWYLSGLYQENYPSRSVGADFLLLRKFQCNEVSDFSLSAFQYIGIDVRCNTYVAMSEVFGYDFQVNTAVQ